MGDLQIENDKNTGCRLHDYGPKRIEGEWARLELRWKRGGSHTLCLFDAPIRIVLQGRPDCLRLVSYSKHILAYAVEFKVLHRAISWYLPLLYFIFIPI